MSFPTSLITLREAYPEEQALLSMFIVVQHRPFTEGVHPRTTEVYIRTVPSSLRSSEMYCISFPMNKVFVKIYSNKICIFIGKWFTSSNEILHRNGKNAVQSRRRLYGRAFETDSKGITNEASCERKLPVQAEKSWSGSQCATRMARYGCREQCQWRGGDGFMGFLSTVSPCPYDCLKETHTHTHARSHTLLQVSNLKINDINLKRTI